MSIALTLPGLIAARPTSANAAPARAARSSGAKGAPAARSAPAHEAQVAEVPPTTPLSDEALLQRHIEGDAGALRTLIERHHDALLRFLIRFMGDRQAAEDVFQDAFLQVHLSAKTFDQTRRFKPWLFTIAANKGRDHRRRRRRRQMLELSAPVDSESGGQSFVDLMAVDVESPTTGLDDRERDALVQRAVDQMPDHLREILLLAYFQRLPYATIADALDIPLGTVKSRLHAAVASFARQWKSVTNSESPQ